MLIFSNPLDSQAFGLYFTIGFLSFTEPFHAEKHEIQGYKAIRFFCENLTSSGSRSRVRLSKGIVKPSHFQVPRSNFRVQLES